MWSQASARPDAAATAVCEKLFRLRNKVTTNLDRQSRHRQNHHQQERLTHTAASSRCCRCETQLPMKRGVSTLRRSSSFSQSWYRFLQRRGTSCCPALVGATLPTSNVGPRLGLMSDTPPTNSSDGNVLGLAYHAGVVCRLDAERRFGYVRAVDGCGTFIFVVGTALTHRMAAQLRVGRAVRFQLADRGRVVELIPV